MDTAATPDRTRILEALDAVADPRTGRGLVAAGLVQALVIGPGRAGFMIEVPEREAAAYEPVRAAAEAALRAIPGVERAQVVLTAEAEPAAAAGVVRVRRGEGAPPARTIAPPGTAPAPQAAAGPRAPASLKPAHVRHVIAVASGKGGVGKSTVAVNLACAMALLGRRVGLLDADVYGPSVPRMTGVDAEPILGPDKKLQPLLAWGLKIMSIGLLVDEASPMIWRGPVASSALNQMLNDVAWASEAEPLDVLVIDMPPGTGDVQLTLAQRVALSGAVIVSTPQEVALIDVRRGVAMFEKTHVPILGIVENMAYFPDPATGAPIPIFGHGGARATAETLGAPFLGEIPIEVALRESGDAGRPMAASGVKSLAAEAFFAIAAQVLEALDAGGGLKPAPRIIVED
jgi:ATP-binding protein involved in chromosome partitioning